MHLLISHNSLLVQFVHAVTAAVSSIMVEAREASNSFNLSMPHVGAFSVDGSNADLQVVCQGVCAPNHVTRALFLTCHQM